MNVSRAVLCAAAILTVVACNKKSDDDDDGKATSGASAEPSGSASAAPAPEPKTTIEARVKTEVDTRADGLVGTPAAAAGATATLHTPKDWATTKGDPTLVASADKKAHIAYGTFDPGAGAAAKLPAVATALGLTDCEWSPPEPLTVGKSKLASLGADGFCKRGKTVVRTAYVAPTAEKLMVVGAWDPDGDSASVFGAMRSVAKVPMGDPTGLAACCRALRQNARSAPPDQRPYLIMAANVCDGMRRSPQGRAQLRALRASMRGARMPSSCR